MRLCILWVLVLVLPACSLLKTENLISAVGWVGVIDHHRLQRSRDWAIDSNVDLYVALTAEELLDETFHAQLTEMFRRYYPKSRSATHRETLRQSLSSARRAGTDYLVYPRLRNLRDQNGLGRWTRDEILFSEINRAQLNMDIYIYAAVNEQLIDVIQIDSKGGIKTREGPSLLWIPLDNYLRQLSQFGQ